MTTVPTRSAGRCGMSDGRPRSVSRNGRAGHCVSPGARWIRPCDRSQGANAGGERVVGQAAGPDQVPEGVGQLRIGAVRVGGGPDLVGDLAEEESVPAGERGEDRLVQRGLLQRVGRREQQWRAVREVDGEPAVLAREGPAPAQTTSPVVVSSSSMAGVYPATRLGRISFSKADAGTGAPCNCSMARASPSIPRRLVSPRCCHWGRKPASAAGGTGSSSRRSAARERRRSRRRTVASHHSWPMPAGWNSPWTTRPDAASRWVPRR